MKNGSVVCDATGVNEEMAMTTRYRKAARWIVLACVVGFLTGTCTTGWCAGRWLTHMMVQAPGAGAVGMPIDTISVPETAGNWVWLVWYDAGTGQWDYDQQTPLVFSDGTVDFVVPQLNQWYFLMICDVATGTYY